MSKSSAVGRYAVNATARKFIRREVFQGACSPPSFMVSKRWMSKGCSLPKRSARGEKIMRQMSEISAISRLVVGDSCMLTHSQDFIVHE